MPKLNKQEDTEHNTGDNFYFLYALYQLYL
jgi:hypothetical protein